MFFFFFSSRRRHTRFDCDWSSDVCSSDLFDGSLAEFVRSPFFGARKVAAFYEIWSRNRTVPKEFLLVRYEQLHAAPAEVLTDVLRFIGARAAAQRHVAAAVHYARFENMRALDGADAFDDPRLTPGNARD